MDFVVVFGVVLLLIAVVGFVQSRARSSSSERSGFHSSDATSDLDIGGEITVRLGTPTQNKRRRFKPKEPITFHGYLRYWNEYKSRTNDYGEHPTSCRICQTKGHAFLVDSLDSAGVAVRCCLQCFRKYAADGEMDRATKGSLGICFLVEAMDAVEKLCCEFPNPAMRPYGEATLRRYIEFPTPTTWDVGRIITKISNKAWTEYDLARIEGKPEPDRT